MVVVENPDLTLKFGEPLEQPVERRIFVDTAVPTILGVNVEGDTNRVQAHLEESPWAAELEETRHQQIVVVSITPGASHVQALIRVVPLQSDKSLQMMVEVFGPQVGEKTP